MNSKLVLALLIGIFLVASLGAEPVNDKVKEEVLQEISEKGEVTVVIKVDPEKKGFFFNTNSVEKIENSLEKPLDRYGDVIVANVSEFELAELRVRNEVESIEPAPSFGVSLQDSRGVIDVERTWPIQINDVNITGIDETICVIDTGVDFTHPDLVGRNWTCVIDCFNQECAEDCSIGDDHGHGTHVTGIAAAANNILGVAHEMKFVGLKVLDSNGDSSATGVTDLSRAMDWCVENREAYNISVISMSLGTTSLLYNSACDSVFSSTWTRSIDNATTFNISVVAATGNSASGIPRNVTHIAAPACIANTTAVSATDKDDTISSYGHYGILVDIVAPGSSINSTSSSGGYELRSGTSMSTPHVAASVALIRQFYLKLKGLVLEPKDISSALKNNGFNLSVDSFNFTRINVTDALLSFDDVVPNVTLTSLANGTFTSAKNLSLKCNATDTLFANLTINLWNSTLLYNQTFFNMSDYNENITTYNYTELPIDAYHWNCDYTDYSDNIGRAETNFTFTVGNLNVQLIDPIDGLVTKTNQTYDCNVTSGEELSNLTFFLWNSTYDIAYNETKWVNGTTNSSSVNYNFTSGDTYNWNCLAVDEQDQESFASVNRSIEYDLSVPQLTIINPVNGSYYNIGTFNLTLNENGTCLYSLDNKQINISLTNINNTEFSGLNDTFTSGLRNVTYICNDTLGNLNTTEVRYFQIDTTKPNVTLEGPNEGASGEGTTSFNFEYNVSDNLNVSTCSLILNGVDVEQNSSTVMQNETNLISRNLEVNDYTWNINCTDQAGNVGNSSERTITVSAPSSGAGGSSSGGGSGGGGGGGIVTSPTPGDVTGQDNETLPQEPEEEEPEIQLSPEPEPIRFWLSKGEYAIIGVIVLIFAIIFIAFLKLHKRVKRNAKKRDFLEYQGER